MARIFQQSIKTKRTTKNDFIVIFGTPLGRSTPFITTWESLAIMHNNFFDVVNVKLFITDICVI